MDDLLTLARPEAPLERAPSPLPEEDIERADSEAFDWTGEDVVVREQRAVAVYRNRSNGIVLREESPDGLDEDAFIVLRDDDAARALVDALQREIRGAS